MSEIQISKGVKPLIPIGEVFGMNPFGLMREFAAEMDRVWSGATHVAEGWAPALEVKHTDGMFAVTAELPGIKKEDLKVETAGNVLTIEGERKHEKKEERPGFFRSERSYGKFYRSIPLPEGAKAEQAKAELTNGILEVLIPVPEMKPARRAVPVTEKAAKETVTH